MEEFCFSQASDEVMEMATNFVDKYVDYIENLPFDLQRSVTRLREIDCICREILTEIEELYASFTKETDISLKRKITLVKIQRLFGRCQELGDEKISIVQQISECIENKKRIVEHASYRFKAIYKPDQKIDFGGKREHNKSGHSKASKRSKRHRHNNSEKQEKEKAFAADSDSITTSSVISTSGARPNCGNSAHDKQSFNLPIVKPIKPSIMTPKIKEDLAAKGKLEKPEKKKNQNASFSSSSGSATIMPSAPQKVLPSSKATSSKAPILSSKAGVMLASSNGSNKPSKKIKKKKKKWPKHHHSDRASTRSPSPQADIPIDPDEPTYCICDQVSFGQMIGCDNKKCPLEWFHFSCVGLTYKPKGKWYCPDCTRDQKDKRKDSKREHK